MEKYLTKKQENNAKLILNHLFYLSNIRLKKTEKFDPYLNEKIWVNYLAINDNNYPISKDDFEILRTAGLDVIII